MAALIILLGEPVSLGCAGATGSAGSVGCVGVQGAEFPAEDRTAVR